MATVADFNWSTAIEHPRAMNRWGAYFRSESLAHMIFAMDTLSCLGARHTKSRLHNMSLRAVAALLGLARAAIVALAAIVLAYPPVKLASMLAVADSPRGFAKPSLHMLDATAWALGAGAISLLTVVSLCVVLTATLSLLSRSAVPILTTIRQIAFLVLRPVMTAVFGIFLHDEPIPFLMWMASGLIVLAAANRNPVAEWWLSLAIIPGVMAIGVAFVLSVGISYWIWSRVIPSAGKIILDVVRYLGEPGYRERIQQLLDNAVRKLQLQPGVQVIFAAHSLGSVIVCDYLANRADPSLLGERVGLITAGSPLRRMILRFFNNPLGLGYSAIDVHTRISGRLPGFYWINVYRPWDPIGTRLAPKNSGVLQEISTGQKRSWLSAHCDYWDDAHVRQMVLAAMSAERFECARFSQHCTAHRRQSWTNVETRGPRSFVLARAFLWCMIGLATLTGAGAFIEDEMFMAGFVRERVTDIRNHGETTLASLSTFERDGSPALQVSFDAASAKPGVRAVNIMLESGVMKRNASAAAIDFARLGEMARHRRSGESRVVHFDNVPLLYDKDRPEQFIIPVLFIDRTWLQTPWYWIKRAIWVALTFLVLTFGYACYALFVAIPCLAMLDGDRARWRRRLKLPSPMYAHR